MSKIYRVVIIGAGGIGSRHLQGLKRSEIPIEIEIVDPSKSSRARIYKSKGCGECNQTGHKGRMGIYEVLEINKNMKQAILSNASQEQLGKIANKNNFRTMQEMGHELLLSGDLSFQEYERQIQSAELTLSEYEEQEKV